VHADTGLRKSGFPSKLQESQSIRGQPTLVFTQGWPKMQLKILT